MAVLLRSGTPSECRFRTKPRELLSSGSEVSYCVNSFYTTIASKKCPSVTGVAPRMALTWHAKALDPASRTFRLICYQKASSLREHIQDWVWHYGNKTVKTGSGLRLWQEDQEFQTSLSTGREEQIIPLPPPPPAGSELHLSRRLFSAVS